MRRGHTDMRERPQGHRKRGVEIQAVYLQAKECQSLTTDHQKLGKWLRRDFSDSALGKLTLDFVSWPPEQ